MLVSSQSEHTPLPGCCATALSRGRNCRIHGQVGSVRGLPSVDPEHMDPRSTTQRGLVSDADADDAREAKYHSDEQRKREALSLDTLGPLEPATQRNWPGCSD